MLFENIQELYSTWNFNPHPVVEPDGPTASYRSLLAALDLGWKVVQPVKLVPSTRHDPEHYSLELCHPDHARLHRFKLPVDLRFSRFIELNGLKVMNILAEAPES